MKAHYKPATALAILAASIEEKVPLVVLKLAISASFFDNSACNKSLSVSSLAFLSSSLAIDEINHHLSRIWTIRAVAVQLAIVGIVFC